MGNPNLVHGFSYHIFIAIILLYHLISKRILYNIPIGENYFYSEMIMHTYLTLNKSGSLHYYFDISIGKYLCLQYINYLTTFITQDTINSNIFILLLV